MKKINRTTNILFLVAIAFVIKAFVDSNPMLALIGIFIVAIAIFRYLLIKQASKDLEEDTNDSMDFVLRYLSKDETLYAQMIVAYKKGKCDVLYEESDGILLYDHTTQTYLASAKNEPGAKDILHKLPQDYGMLIVYEEVFTHFDKLLLPYSYTLNFEQYRYTQKGKYKLPEHNITFKMLEDKDIEVVKQNYKVDDLCNDEYIKKCMERGMLGAYKEDILLGFIGLHESGAMGMLEVFEPYRRKHIGMVLEMEYINYLLQQQCEIIYTQVEVNNKASQNLQEKLHLEKAKAIQYWYFS